MGFFSFPKFIGRKDRVCAWGSFNNKTVSGAPMFDYYLVEKTNPSSASLAIELVIFMKIQFLFKDNLGDSDWSTPPFKKTSWTKDEKKDFVDEWVKTIRSSWDNIFVRDFFRYPVRLRLEFETSIDGISFGDYWEISVLKKFPKDFRDNVNYRKRTSELSFSANNFSSATIEKNSIVRKSKTMTISFTEFEMSTSQQTSPHEFGHMIGLSDEYDEALEDNIRRGHKEISFYPNEYHQTEFHSIMHYGPLVFQRHLEHFSNIILGVETRLRSGLNGCLAPIGKLGIDSIEAQYRRPSRIYVEGKEIFYYMPVFDDQDTAK